MVEAHASGGVAAFTALMNRVGIQWGVRLKAELLMELDGESG